MPPRQRYVWTGSAWAQAVIPPTYGAYRSEWEFGLDGWLSEGDTHGAPTLGRDAVVRGPADTVLTAGSLSFPDTMVYKIIKTHPGHSHTVAALLRYSAFAGSGSGKFRLDASGQGNGAPVSGTEVTVPHSPATFAGAIWVPASVTFTATAGTTRLDLRRGSINGVTGDRVDLADVAVLDASADAWRRWLVRVWDGTKWLPDLPQPAGVLRVDKSLRWDIEAFIAATKSLRWSLDDATPLPASPQRANGSSSASWRSSDDWTTGYVYQGEYGSNGVYRGLWFYGSNPFPSLRGLDYTVTDVKIRMRRTASGGDGGDSTVYVGTHNYTSRPSGTPTVSNVQSVGTLAWGGETKEFDLPNSWGADLIEGNIRGFGLYRSTGSPYFRTEGVDNYSLDGRVSISFS